jgi:hypothetical protein
MLEVVKPYVDLAVTESGHCSREVWAGDQLHALTKSESGHDATA